MSGVHQPKGNWLKANCPKRNWVNPVSALFALSAYDVSRYGNLEGRVQRIASNTTIEEGQAPYYQTMVEVPNLKFSKSDEKVEIVPGMTVVIDIIGKKRSMLSYILTPLNRASGVVFRER